VSFINGVKNRVMDQPLVWDTLTTTFFSTVGKGVGFLVPFFIAAWFGVSQETDAFFFVYGLVLFLAGVFANAVESVIVPFITELEAQDGDVASFVGKVMGAGGLIVVLALGAFLLFFLFFLPLILHFSPGGLHLVYVLLWETSLLVLLLTWTSVLSGALNAQKSFSLPAVSPAIRASVALAFIFLFKGYLGIHAVAWGYVVGEFLRMFVLFFGARSKGIVSWFSFSINLDRRLREFLHTASYQAVAMLASGLNPVVDKTMASWLPVGSVSVLHYANRLFMIPVVFFSSGLMVTLLSHWGSRYWEWGIKKLRMDVNKAVKVVAISSLILMIGLVVFSYPLTKLVLAHGSFTVEKVPQVRLVWVCYLVGLPFYLLGVVYSRAHLVLKNTHILMKRALYINLINISFNYVFMKFMGVAGIALSSSIASVCSLLYISVTFYRSSFDSDVEEIGEENSPYNV